MTYQQPLNNVVRGTVMALAGVLGGTQSLGVSGYDEAISVPSEHAHQMSLRIQQILQSESRLTDVADPLGGSYFIESLTAEVEKRAWEFFEQIQSRGGFIACLDSGWMHARASENQIKLFDEIESGVRSVVGVNTAQGDAGTLEVEGFRGTSDAWERGMERLTALRRERDASRTREALRALRTACAGSTNVMPAMMDAVAADVTVGEIGDVFRDVFGDWKVPIEF
jgi:methylmalonyl-CoA mutase N-terminal domain/subunit